MAGQPFALADMWDFAGSTANRKRSGEAASLFIGAVFCQIKIRKKR